MGSDTANVAPEDRTQTRYAWRVLTVSALGGLLAGLNTSTMDVALPSVSRHFNASPTQASWILLSYLLMTSSLILTFGRVTDLIGRRRLYLVGLSLLSTASLLSGFAPNVYWLIGLRCVQGIGAAALICNITALLTDAFPERLIPTALGFNVTIAVIGQVLGPVLGGLLVDVLDWRAVFWFNVPLGFAGVVWAWFTLRRDQPTKVTEPFDNVGAILSVIATAGLVVALSEGNTRGWTSVPVLIGIAAFAVAGPLFVRLERRLDYPLVDLRLFADRERSLAYLALFLMALSRFAVVLIMALYLQAATGMSALHAGEHVFFLAAGLSAASPIAGRLTNRYGARLLSSAGMGLSAVALFTLAAVIRPQLNSVLLASLLLLLGAGAGLFTTPNTSSIMVSVPKNRRGVANGARSGIQQFGYVVSTALVLALITTNLSDRAKKDAYAGTLSKLSPYELSRFTAGYHLALVVLGVICTVGMVASLLRNPRRAPRPAGDAVADEVAAIRFG